jgi:hypothetical protein
LLGNKYQRAKSLSQVTAKPNDSNFWRGVMHIKDDVLCKGTFEVKDGTNTRFWEDTWVGDQPLKVKYPNLYNIVRDPRNYIKSFGHKHSQYLFQKGFGRHQT